MLADMILFWTLIIVESQASLHGQDVQHRASWGPQ
jgi:hypothetical protein